MDIKNFTISRAKKAIAQKDISVRELVEACLNEVENKAKLNSFITITSDLARESARQWDKKISQGEQLPALAGIPGSLKDVFCTKGIRTTGASNVLRDYFPPYDATAARKLNEAGFVLIGKTNTDEFTMGSSTETSAFGAARNPYDEEHVAGGSSGGSACSVAALQALFSLGTDTGGSIRQPAAFCGVVGLKPTYGLVSRFGVMSMASSLDTIGPIAKTVEDIAVILEVISGNDTFDTTTTTRDIPQYSRLINESLGEVTVGIPREYLNESGMDKEILDGFERAKELLEALGVKIKEISLPHSSYALNVYYIIVPAEVSSNLARYDGIKYGNPQEASSILEHYLETRGHGFGVEAKRRILIGTFVLSKGYYQAYYGKAQKARTLIRRDFEEAFKEVDVILSPVFPVLPFKVGEKIGDPLKMYLADVFTVSANLTGIPALSIPVKFMGKFPVSVQLMGPQFSEELLLRLGHHFEQARGPMTSAHTR